MCARMILTGLIFCFGFKMSLAAVTVGTCRPGKNTYPTISAAIEAVPAGGVVNVCPGTYAEQLEIDKPLTLRGVDGTPTIVAPSTGLNELPAGSGFFPQVLADNAREVRLLNLAIDGSDALFNVGGVVLGVEAYCPEGVVTNFTGVYFVDTSGILEGMNVSNQFGESFPGGFGFPQLIPNCGNGIVFHGRGIGIVRKTTVSDVGFYGIFADGALIAEHNVVSGGNGPFGIGIGAGTGAITENTVTGTVAFQKTIGIEGGDLVKGNDVESSIYGVANAGNVMRNTVNNNAISLSMVERALDNRISAPSTYFNPACFFGACDGTPTGPPFPTIGIDFGCDTMGPVIRNKIEGVGIGFANVPRGERIHRMNTLINVTTISTTCSQ
jgi:hypothetical protein